MIEILNGIRETIVYDPNMPVRLHLNVDAEDYPAHWQTAIEVIMPIDNIYTIRIENNDITLKPNDIIFISPGVIHEIFAPPQGRRYILLIDPSLFNNFKDLDSLYTMFYPYVIFNSEFTNPTDVSKNSMSHFLHDIYKEYSGNNFLKYPAVYSYLLQLLIGAARNRTSHFVITSVTKSQLNYKYVKKFLNVCNYINDHCTENLGVEDLAKLSGFSESHFIRLFKQFTSISYYSYLNQCRIDYAKNLLTSSPSLTIMEISLSSGFGSLATFNRLFKAKVKCTPSEYRGMYVSCNYIENRQS